MAVGYGSKFEPAKLIANRVGAVPDLESTSALGFVSWALLGLEFAAGLIPGVGIGVSTAIAAIGTASQLGIEAAETGTVSATSLGIGAAGLVLPGALQGVSLFKQGSRLAESVQPYVGRAISDIERDIPALLERGLPTLGGSTSIRGEPLSGMGMNLLGEPVQLGERVTQFGGRLAGATNDPMLMNKPFEMFRGRVKTQQVARLEAQQLFKEMQGASWINPRKMDKASELLGRGRFRNDAIIRLEKAAKLSKDAGTVSRSTKDVEEDVRLRREIQRTLRKRFGITVREARQLARLVKNGRVTNAGAWWRMLRESFARSGNLKLGKVIKFGSTSKGNKVFKVLSKSESSYAFRARILKKGISSFQKGVGFITSPASVVSEIVSKTLGKLSSKWEQVGETIGEKISAIINKGYKGVKVLEEEFEKSGGRLLKSKWIMGYKLINSELEFHTILIQFKPYYTKNKQPVVATLSTTQLNDFLVAPSKGRWYIDHIARARNGHPIDELGFDLSQYLGFLPVEQIQVVMGLYSASNSLKTTIGAGKAIWNKAYWGGLEQAVVSSLISEVGKMAGNTFTSGGEILKTTIEDSVKGVLQKQSVGAAFGEGFKGAFKQDAKRQFEQRSGKNVNALRSKIEPIKSMKALGSM